jgi:CO/xanthine dehydrogenase FAD-binding subunit
MIIEYKRPKSIAEALDLLAREQPRSYPLGGGTYLNRSSDEQYAVIDLQDLQLDGISKQGNNLQAGATTTLQSLAEYPGLPEVITTVIKFEATYNLRYMATIAGTLVTANGRSPLTTLLLALDTSLEFLGSDTTPMQVRLGDWLPVRSEQTPVKLISKVSFSLNAKIAYESVARSPADQPIVCAAVAVWPSGRTRLALGGWGQAPVLAMDGPEAQGIETTARYVYSQAADEWASAEYRLEMAGILALRCLKQINSD